MKGLDDAQEKVGGGPPRWPLANSTAESLPSSDLLHFTSILYQDFSNFSVYMKHLRILLIMQVQIQWFWSRASNSAFLTKSQVMLMPLVCRLYLSSKSCLFSQYSLMEK